MKFILKLKKKFEDNSKLNENSINNYINNLKLLNDGVLNNISFLKDKDNINEKLNKKNKFTKRNYLISIYKTLSLFKSYNELKDFYGKKLGELNKDLNENSSKKENKNWKEILNIYNSKAKKRKNNYNQYQNMVIASLYVLLPPRRNHDYILMKVSNYSSTDNYMKDGKFYFNNYKTDKIYKETVIKIPDRLKRIINNFLKFKKENNLESDYLLSDENGKKYNYQSKILDSLKSYLGVGSTELRHSYLEYHFKDKLDDMKDKAYKMSHSLSTQKYYIEK
jgi:hypothetical protein